MFQVTALVFRGCHSIHPGVTCDKSGMSPIAGTRYNLADQDYDLCQVQAKMESDPWVGEPPAGRDPWMGPLGGRVYRPPDRLPDHPGQPRVRRRERRAPAGWDFR